MKKHILENIMNEQTKINELIAISKNEIEKRTSDINFFTKPMKGETKEDIEKANKLLKDIDNTPHYFVLACVMDMGMQAEYVWIIPYKITKAFFELGYIKNNTIEEMANIEYDKYDYVFTKYYNKKLHRYNYMTERFYKAILHIKDKYNCNAANIWKNEPSSKTVVQRFREFYGVGQKISTMATNILAREFRIKYSDYSSVDISLDVQVIFVMKRLGIVNYDEDEDLFKASIVLKCREMNPDYPGIFDYALWKAGRDYCTEKKPNCKECYFKNICLHFTNLPS
jgi:endonuclease III